jgi:uncharacterized coiled-coil DUF342 family protein
MTMHDKLARLRELNEADLDQLLQPFGRGISRNMAIQMITAIESMNGTIDAQAKKIEELASALDRRLQQDLPHIILPELQKKMAAQAKKIETLKAACIDLKYQLMHMNKKEADEMEAHLANISEAATEAANAMSLLAGEIRSLQVAMRNMRRGKGT